MAVRKSQNKVAKKATKTGRKTGAKVKSKTAGKTTGKVAARTSEKSTAKSVKQTGKTAGVKSKTKTKSKTISTGKRPASTAAAYDASSHEQASNILQFGTDAVRQFFAGGSGSDEMGQDIFAIGKGTTQHLASSTGAAAKSVENAAQASKENLEAGLEYSSIAMDISKELLEELFHSVNRAFSDNMELSQEILNCRTISDVMELQSKVMRTNMDNFFTESAQLSEIFFRFASEAAEPINNRVADMAKNFGGGAAA